MQLPRLSVRPGLMPMGLTGCWNWAWSEMAQAAFRHKRLNTLLAGFLRVSALRLNWCSVSILCGSSGEWTAKPNWLGTAAAFVLTEGATCSITQKRPDGRFFSTPLSVAPSSSARWFPVSFRTVLLDRWLPWLISHARGLVSTGSWPADSSPWAVPGAMRPRGCRFAVSHPVRVRSQMAISPTSVFGPSSGT